ncbi:spherulin-1b [Plakobranchus ocellatus]|uniref:Spherulin-1b n=1 Tax=Plakobranchus ocellatus TaxID=259542 RepID=A0AAV3ZUN6_9GAST|nr:spherulin-1b [Plakobranchus ocellatus]
MSSGPTPWAASNLLQVRADFKASLLTLRPPSPFAQRLRSRQVTYFDHRGVLNCSERANHLYGGVGGTVDSESALRSAGNLLSRVRAPPLVPWLDGGLKA